MRPDHAANEFVQPQPLLVSPLANAEEAAPRASTLTRVTFCFAWLFGLEPFLSGVSDDAPHSRIKRH